MKDYISPKSKAQTSYIDDNNFMLISDDVKISKPLSNNKSLSFKCKPMFDDMGLQFGKGLAIDLGAFIGDTTTYFLENGYDEVIAVEADPLHFKCLEHNCPTSTNINCLISDVTGEEYSRLKYDDASKHAGVHKNPGSLVWGEKAKQEKFGLNWFYSASIKSMTLDEITSDVDSCNVIKMDIQGFEIEAFDGGINFFNRCKPIIVTEVDPSCLSKRGHTGDDLINKILSLGFYSIALRSRHDILFVPDA